MAETWELSPQAYETLIKIRNTNPIMGQSDISSSAVHWLLSDKLICTTLFTKPPEWRITRLGACALELYEARAAIVSWVSAKDAEAAYHAAHGDGFVSHDEATVLAMEAVIDTAEDALRAIVAEGG